MTAPLPDLPLRDPAGHKGTFGTVCVIGGQSANPAGGREMVGGPAFTATAALRAGAGLAVLAVPQPLLTDALVIAPSATGLALPVDGNGRLQPSESATLLDQHLSAMRCVAIGPGFGSDEPQQQIVVRMIARDDLAIVIDADAINALAELTDVHVDLRCHAVLTPHPGEYRRIAAALGIDADPTDDVTRDVAARQLAQRLGCVVVLKGHRTVISDGINAHVNTTGSAALATAGTGDVLTGIIAGLIAQFFKPNLGPGSRQVTAAEQGGLSLFECARLGVYLHGKAADMWSAKHGDAGLLATDLLELIPDALHAHRART